MKILGKILSLLIVIILAADLAAFQFLFSADSKAAKADFYLDRLEAAGFYGDAHQYISSTMKSLITNKEISEKITGGVVTEDWVTAQTQIFVVETLDYLMDNRAALPVVDYSPVIENFIGNVDRFIKEIGIKLEFIEDAMITALRRNIEEAQPKLPFSSSWNEEEKAKFAKTLDIPKQVMMNIRPALYISCAAGIILLALLLLLGSHGRRLAGISLVIGGISAILLSVSASTSFMISKLMSRLPPDLTASLPSIRPVMASIVKGLVNPVLLSGAILAAFGIILMIANRRKAPMA